MQQHPHTPGPLAHFPSTMIASAMQNQMGALGITNLPGNSAPDARPSGPTAAAGAGTTAVTGMLPGEQAVHGGRFDFDDG